VRRFAWIAVWCIFIARAIAAFSLPLTGDEAYYWEWSKRLAFGYVDHPPAVAWTIRSLDWLGHEPGFVRLGCVLCGVVATLALAACASLLAGDPRAGAVTALAFSLTPLATVAFASASPDGIYLACWALALWLAARAFRWGHPLDFAFLGLALGGALLARMFGFALLAGVVAYALTRGRTVRWANVGLALAVALLTYAPFLVWNAEHGWVTFAFSLIHRHGNERGGPAQLAAVLGEEAAAYSPGLWLAAVLCALRPRNALLAWTSLPLLGGLTAFALFRSVEIHWIFGAFASLCVMLGIAYVDLSPRARTLWAFFAGAPAAVLLVTIFVLALAPAPSYSFARRTLGLHLRNGGPFEIFTFRALAADAARLARERGAVVMTDGYGLSSVLDFDAAIAPVVIGYDWQGRESRAWYPSSEQPQRALFVDKEPLATRPDFVRQLGRACRKVVDGGTHAYAYAGLPPRTFYFTWCEGLVPQGLAILRWEREG
jgi:4-amino-4-deoxy-L-arabinose transferase-like glycosyltransferase